MTKDLNYIIEYDDFAIIQDDSGKYWYFDKREGEEPVFEAVKEIASMYYDVIHDVKASGEELSELFDCDVCGEMVTDDFIAYRWFDFIEKP